MLLTAKNNRSCENVKIGNYDNWEHLPLSLLNPPLDGCTGMLDEGVCTAGCCRPSDWHSPLDGATRPPRPHGRAGQPRGEPCSLLGCVSSHSGRWHWLWYAIIKTKCGSWIWWKICFYVHLGGLYSDQLDSQFLHHTLKAIKGQYKYMWYILYATQIKIESSLT